MTTEKYTKPLFWDYPDRFPNKYMLAYNWRERKTDSYIFGKAITLPCPDLPGFHTSQDPTTYDLIFDAEVSEEKLRQYDHLPNTTLTPIINERFYKLLLDFCPDDFQVFPVKIRCINPKIPYFEINDYMLVNITHQAGTLDHVKSKARWDEDMKKYRFERTILVEGDTMEGHHLARLREFHPQILMSQDLVRYLRHHKLKGIQYEMDEEWNGLWTDIPEKGTPQNPKG